MEDAGFLQIDRLRQRSTQGGRELSMNAARGERMVLLGPPASGKTGLLHAIAGFERVAGGTVMLDGRDVTQEPPERRRMAFVPAAGALLGHRSVLGNVAFPLQLRGMPRPAVRAQAQALLERFGLAALSRRRPASLAPTERRQAELARAVAAEPLLLLIDSPSAAPPPPDLLAHTDLTALVATDDAAAAMGLASRIALLNQGRIEQVGTPHDLYDRPATAFAARFMGPCNLIPREDGVLSIRPHRLRIDPQGPVRGVVRLIAYQGAVTRITLDADPLGDILIDMTCRPEALGVGDPTGVSWSGADAWPVPNP